MRGCGGTQDGVPLHELDRTNSSPTNRRISYRFSCSAGIASSRPGRVFSKARRARSVNAGRLFGGHPQGLALTGRAPCYDWQTPCRSSAWSTSCGSDRSLMVGGRVKGTGRDQDAYPGHPRPPRAPAAAGVIRSQSLARLDAGMGWSRQQGRCVMAMFVGHACRAASASGVTPSSGSPAGRRSRAAPVRFG